VKITLLENFRAAFYAPFYAASALGAYKAEGLEVELSSSVALGKALQAVGSGAGQVSWGGPLRVMAALDADPNSGYVAFCEVVGRDPFYLVGRKPNPSFRIADLPQWTLARVTEVPTPWICLQYDLRRAGINPAGIRQAPERGLAANAEALRSGEVELIQTFEPFATQLAAEGVGHVWYASSSRGPTSYTTFNTTRAFLQREPGVALGMTRAMYRTLRWVAAHDGRELARLIADYFPGLPEARLAACCDGYKARDLWNTTPILRRTGLEWLRDAMLAAGAIRTSFTYEACTEMRFAEQVVRENPPAQGN
jgi:NitT/TauT family transport system substrate-binding protein